MTEEEKTKQRLYNYVRFYMENNNYTSSEGVFQKDIEDEDLRTFMDQCFSCIGYPEIKEEE
jgi:hypothetical protein